VERPRADAQTESRRSLYEELAEQSLRFLESLVGQQHRFGFADRVRDEALLMESVHGASIKSFPCPGAIMQRQIKKCEDGFIDFFGIDIHARASHMRSTGSRGIAYF
jgi:hypothetical protein